MLSSTTSTTTASSSGTSTVNVTTHKLVSRRGWSTSSICNRRELVDASTMHCTYSSETFVTAATEATQPSRTSSTLTPSAAKLYSPARTDHVAVVLVVVEVEGDELVDVTVVAPTRVDRLVTELRVVEVSLELVDVGEEGDVELKVVELFVLVCVDLELVVVLLLLVV
eukprot:3762197-Amphidinium_carterae.1